MRIGINTRLLIDGRLEGIGWYTYEITKRLIASHPEHEFILFFDRPFSEKFNFGRNATNVILNPQARHPILFKIWFDFSITKALKKYKIDLFFSPDGYLSLRTEVPQIPVIHDLNFEHHPEDMPKIFLRYYKTNFPKFARKARHIITVSQYSKEDICNTYSVDAKKVSAIWNGVSDEYGVLPEDEKTAIREKISKENKYFLFVGSLHPRKNLLRLLAAYDEYCTKCSEPIHLVIVGEELWKNSGQGLQIKEANRDKVHFTGRLAQDELVKIMGAAYALTFVPYFEGFGIPLVEAMKSGIPVLAAHSTALPEIAGDAAVYCDPLDVEDIANKLILLSEDETLVQSLSSKGLERAKLFSWDKAANEVWKIIETSKIQDQ